MPDPRTWTKRAIKLLARALFSVARPRRRELPLSWWRLSRAPDGELLRDGAPLRQLLERFGSPLHVVDVQQLEANAREYLSAAPAVRPYYSYKTNPVPGVLRRLHGLGVGAEVISPYELWLALALGVPAERIIYNGPGKSDESLQQAVGRGVLVNVNARSEIARLAQAARAVGRRARTGVRVVPRTGWGGQFGEPIAGGLAFKACAEVVANPDLFLEALHAHPGREVATAAQARAFAAEVLALRGEVKARLGHAVNTVDLGGSLACPTARPHGRLALRLNRSFGWDLQPGSPEVLRPREHVSLLQEMARQHAREAGGEPPAMVVEPGRALTGNTQLLLCRVVALREGDQGMPFAVLDAGINLADPVRSAYHQILALQTRGAERRYRLVGPICTLADVLCYGWPLPELRPGDGLAILDSGAYFVPFATSFSFPQPAIVEWEEGQARLLRRAESFDDLVALDQIQLRPD